jgi:hypothetical protein
VKRDTNSCIIRESIDREQQPSAAGAGGDPFSQMLNIGSTKLVSSSDFNLLMGLSKLRPDDILIDPIPGCTFKDRFKKLLDLYELAHFLWSEDKVEGDYFSRACWQLEPEIQHQIELAKSFDAAAVIKSLHDWSLSGYLTVPIMNKLLGLLDEDKHGDRLIHPNDWQAFDNGGNVYEPTAPWVLKEIFTEISIRSGASFFDLGSGNGHVVLYGAIARSDVSFTGIELMPRRVERSQAAAKATGIKNANFVAGDVLQVDFSAADVVFLFDPFTEQVTGQVRERLEVLANSKPLVVIDYYGHVIGNASWATLVSKVEAYYVYVSTTHREESRKIAGISGPE